MGVFSAFTTYTGASDVFVTPHAVQRQINVTGIRARVLDLNLTVSKANRRTRRFAAYFHRAPGNRDAAGIRRRAARIRRDAHVAGKRSCKFPIRRSDVGVTTARTMCRR